MGLDIRWPIGLMFSLIGVLLVIYGLDHRLQPGDLRALARHQHQPVLGPGPAGVRRGHAHVGLAGRPEGQGPGRLGEIAKSEKVTTR